MTRWSRFARQAAAVLMLWLGSLGCCIAAEVIHAFDATVVLAKDGELTVTERIRVRAEGNAIKRGIFRDFPLTFTDAQGQRREVSFTLLDVTCDGKPQPHNVNRNLPRDFVRIYVGDQKVFLQPGDYTYVIRYRTARQVRWFDGKPELNWNVTGNFWSFPIHAASYRLELAGGLPPERWSAYTGKPGERGTAWRGQIDAGGALSVSTTQTLQPGQGLTVVAALPGGAVGPPEKEPDPEVIQAFDATVALAQSGQLTVTERIRVHAEGNAIKHGIFRDFPLTFTDAQGQRREVSFKLLDVTRDGKPQPYTVDLKQVADFAHITIGDKDALLQPGDYTYVIRYRTARQVRWFDGKPELNWNVTGNFWKLPINAASYRLELAGGLPPERWSAYTGKPGERSSAWHGQIDASGALSVSTTQTLQPGQGLTVVAALPDGAVAPPAAIDKLWLAVLDNRAWIFSALGFVIVLGYYLAAWNAVGRDPKPGTIIPLFHPPKDISPAQANYIVNWGLGSEPWRAFTAAVLSLAVQGRVRLEHSGDALTVQATGKAVVPLAGERAITKKLNELGGTLVIDKAHGGDVAAMGSEFTSDIDKENKNHFFRRHLGYVLVGLALTLATIGSVVWYGGLGPAQADVVWQGFVGVFSFLGFLTYILFQLVKDFANATRAGRVLRVAIVLIVLGGLAFIAPRIPVSVLGRVPGRVLNFAASHPLPLVVGGGFVALNGLFIYLIRAPTALGRMVMDQLAGFKLYLRTAESHRLNMSAPAFTAERFEALLPYAVALNVEKPWSDAFAAALKRAHPQDADPMRGYQPAWTSSAWSSASFGSAVAATVASMSSALSSAVPVSSSSSGFSSGGGGSGGGGGGGGGGGW